MKRILYIDFLNILYRAFYGMSQMRSTTNIPTGAFYGFIKTLKKTIEKYNIDTIIIFNDSKESIRKQKFSTYKGNRDKKPDELEEQRKMLLEFFQLINIPVITVEGYEADDGIYSATVFAVENPEHTIFILSSDKDLHCLLLYKNTYIIDLNKNILLDEEWLKKEYDQAITKNKILLYYALCGDTSDNISGIKGIGKKTGKKIIALYDSLDEAYKDKFVLLTGTERIKNLLLSNKSAAYDSAFLLQPLLYDTTYFKEYITQKWQKESFEKGNELLKKYECFSLLSEKEQNQFQYEEIKKIPYAKDLYTVKICQNKEDLEILKNIIASSNIIALDTETDSGNPMKAIMIGYSIAVEVNSAWYIPLYEQNNKSTLYEEKIQLFSLLTSDKKIIMHNALFDMHVIEKTTGHVPENIFDTMIAAHVFREQKIGLKDLSINIFKEKMHSFSEIMEFGKYKTFDEIEIHTAASYAATDARQTLLLFFHYQNLLKQDTYKSYNILFDTVEMPLIPVLQAIESTGIYCDSNILAIQEIKYQEKIYELKQEIDLFTKTYNFQLNPASHKQTSFFLYDVLKIPVSVKAKTDQKTLHHLSFQYNIIDLILKYRSMQSNISHFTTGLLKYIQPDGKIHTHYQQFITITGRITTMNPNLQNIPRSHDLASIRNAFHAGENFILASFDYSQIELRIVAFLAQDTKLLDLFNNNKDIHLLTAAFLFNKSINIISQIERQIAKKINFSIIYSQSAFSLARELNISSSKAKEYIDIYKSHYPRIFEWMNETIKKASSDGYVETLYGLKRHIPELKEKNKVVFKSGERMAINTIIQGTAAEIMKKSMIAVYQYLKKCKIGKIVLQLHDEILVEIPESTQNIMIKEIKKIMESVVNWSIVLQVNIKINKKWK